MTIAAARRYRSGTLECELSIDGGPRGPLSPGSFDWVGLSEPTEQEMDLVRRQFGLHLLAVEDAMVPGHQPKVDVFGKQLLIVARTAALVDGESIDYGQTAIFLGADFVISVRFGSARAHVELRSRLEADQERLAEGPDFVAHAILDFIVDGYQPVHDALDRVAQSLEESAIGAFPDSGTIRRIFRLRRQLRRFERIVGPTVEMCDRLATTDLPSVDPSARIWFRDVLDHVRHSMARVQGLKETLAAIVETAGLLEQQRQGAITRQLAAWAAILAVPTAIAGIYGMNFDIMPELRWRYGYFVILGALTAVCGGLFIRFRKIGWL